MISGLSDSFCYTSFNFPSFVVRFGSGSFAHFWDFFLSLSLSLALSRSLSLSLSLSLSPSLSRCYFFLWISIFKGVFVFGLQLYYHFEILCVAFLEFQQFLLLFLQLPVFLISRGLSF